MEVLCEIGQLKFIAVHKLFARLTRYTPLVSQHVLQAPLVMLMFVAMIGMSFSRMIQCVENWCHQK